jgi:hypothetical protein
MSDRMQYLIGGLISVALAIGYLTLTDREPNEVSEPVDIEEISADTEAPAGDG